MKKSFKILVITPFFYPHWGGSERYISELYSHLLKKHHNISVDVLTYDVEKTNIGHEKFRGMNIYRVPAWNVLPGQFALPNYVRLIALLKQLKAQNAYHVVNSHTRFFDNSWWAPLAAKYLGAKSILSDHCADHPQHTSFVVKAITKTIDHILIPCLTRMYDRVVATSDATQRFLVEHGAKKVNIISNGIDVSRYGARVDKRSSQVRIAFVGRMIRSKGALIALAVARIMVKKNPKLVFTFAGDGFLLPEMQLQAIANKIIFTGSLNSVQVKKLLRKTDILLYPSIHHDGLPTVLLEAGMAKCAVIASTLPAVQDVIKHGVTGISTDATVTSFEKEVNVLVKSHKLRSVLGANLHALVQKQFDWSKSADRFYQLLIGLL